MKAIKAKPHEFGRIQATLFLIRKASCPVRQKLCVIRAGQALLTGLDDCADHPHAYVGIKMLNDGLSIRDLFINLETTFPLDKRAPPKAKKIRWLIRRLFKEQVEWDLKHTE